MPLPSSHASDPAAAAFELRGRMQTLTVLRLKTGDVAKLARQLDHQIAQAPEMFRGMPVVLDLEGVVDSRPDLPTLVGLLRGRGIEVMGVRGGAMDAAARAAGLAVLAAEVESPRRIVEPRRDRVGAMVVTRPVRSGQQIYARGGDLVVLAAISPGAEILADGHIHVYASLRGRALAGVRGNVEARIFCRSLEAELVSIAGHYQINEQFADAAQGPVQIFLRGDALCIEPL